MKSQYFDITGTSNILSTLVAGAHNASTSVATIEARTTTLDIGDFVEIELGYTTDFNKVFSGYVKSVDRDAKDNKYIISAQDVMVRAVDYFIASSTPDSPFTRQNIAAETLVRDLLALAGLTSYNFDATSFTFATQGPLEINLVSSYDICHQIAGILAWHLYADEDGQVHFVNRKPYLMGGDTATINITDSDILSSTYAESDADLRNRVVVYGNGTIAATAEAVSPFLPAGFFKSTVLATEFIDSQANAQSAADFNLALLNRLNKSVSVQIEGNPNILPRTIVNYQDTQLGISEDYYVYAVDHRSGPDGYVCELELRV